MIKHWVRMQTLNQNIIINQLNPTEKRWFAVYTKYKCEKYVADVLFKKGIEAYVPLISKTRRYTRKIKTFHTPLINCYVFTNIIKDQYIPVLETEYVMKFLRQGKDLLSIPNAEIQILKRISGDVIEAYSISSEEFQSGELVEVASGHLTGMKGKIVSRSGKHSFVVDLDTIGFQLRINIDLKLLKPINHLYLTA
ncbi:MAG: UpxY family transcription antiterminator [Saprospiraceae bacterium]|nr:UpxY family transcription antiterminator [Saprospiraceae bacterium]